MTTYIPGQRYSMTMSDVTPILSKMWPVVRSKPDLSRGRRFVKEPCDWEFWMEDGTKVSFSFNPGEHFIASQSRERDPERPEIMSQNGESK